VFIYFDILTSYKFDFGKSPSASRSKRLTASITGAGAGVASVWEQKKLEARKMLENAADSPASSARFVRRFLDFLRVLELSKYIFFTNAQNILC
jgi:hypothetical protein